MSTAGININLKAMNNPMLSTFVSFGKPWFHTVYTGSCIGHIFIKNKEKNFNFESFILKTTIQ